MNATPPAVEVIRDYVIAAHGNLPKVQTMLAERPELLNVVYEWGPGNTETGIQAAAHVGSRPVAEYLLAQGAPLEICTAAMLGRQAAVEDLLKQDPAKIQATGAHGIPLLAHAALSGSVPLTQMLVGRGATQGISFALSNAVTLGHAPLTHWLLDNGQPDLGWKNFQDKTPLMIAVDNGNDEIAGLLRAHGATA